MEDREILRHLESKASTQQVFTNFTNLKNQITALKEEKQKLESRLELVESNVQFLMKKRGK